MQQKSKIKYRVVQPIFCRIARKNKSTGAFFFKGIAGRMPPLLGLEVFALGTPCPGFGEARSLRFSGEERLGVAWIFGTGNVATLDAVGEVVFALR